jgi:drug/metabolite transporter (DMT)-like permease
MSDHRRPPALRATLIGGGALLLWATLAVLTTWTGAVPPFQTVATAFGIAAAVALAKWLVRGESVAAHLDQPLGAWLLGVGGLFGYHALFFLALKTAPPVEANLVNYLWPLLIVLFSGVLPGERLRPWHVGGAAAGFAGLAVLLGGRVDFQAVHVVGYLAALAAAVVWAAYSVANRRFHMVPSDAVGGFCAAGALLALAGHLLFEPTVRPSGGEWLALVALGLGPAGGAFFLWDHGVKHGHIRALGAWSYGTPLLSTLLLVLSGRGAADWRTGLALVLIVGGAAVASVDLWRRRAT